MKKIFLASSLFVFAITGTVKAQTTNETIKSNTGDPTAAKGHEGNKGWILIESVQLGASNGPQTVNVPGGRGTLKFEKNGEVFSNVVFVETTTLKDHRALLVNKFEKVVPQTPCKYPLPNGCFQSADKSFAMRICKPTDLTSNTGPYTIALLLPAVQAARQAANGAN